MKAFDVLRTADKDTMTSILTAYISAAISGDDMEKMAAIHDTVQKSVTTFLDLDVPDEEDEPNA